MLFADSDSEGEYLPFGNDDRSSNDCASPGTSLHAQWCRVRRGAVRGGKVRTILRARRWEGAPEGET